MQERSEERRLNPQRAEVLAREHALNGSPWFTRAILKAATHLDNATKLGLIASAYDYQAANYQSLSSQLKCCGSGLAEKEAAASNARAISSEMIAGQYRQTLDRLIEIGDEISTRDADKLLNTNAGY